MGQTMFNFMYTSSPFQKLSGDNHPIDDNGGGIPQHKGDDDLVVGYIDDSELPNTANH